MKEHTRSIIDSDPGGLCLAFGWQNPGAGAAKPETSMSDLLAKVERQSEIIGDLLVKNEQLRNQLRRIEHSTPANPGQDNELEPPGNSSR